jgi:uncharacterized protein (TIGR03086 family)
MDPAALPLLERSVAYALGAVGHVDRAALTRPTPCPAWDVARLLEHVVSSMDALLEGLDAECVGLVEPMPRRDHADPVTAFRGRAARLLGSCAAPRAAGDVVLIGDRMLAAHVLSWVGSLELTVHGWDVARACGEDRPIPRGLARNLLAVVPLVVTDDARDGAFAPPATLPAGAGPGERLLAYLGRDVTPGER